MPSEKKNVSGVIPIYINNFNCLRSVRELVSFFSEINGCEVIIVDNESTYEPLLQWYANRPCKIISLGGNYGHLAPWKRGVILDAASHRAIYGTEYYIVTDPDISLNLCPKDLLSVLISCFEKYPTASKIGLGLKIDDLPEDFPLRSEVINWESQFWKNRVDQTLFKANVDTTFAMYRAQKNPDHACRTDNSYRTDAPYVARHLPWYLTAETLTEEDLFRMKHIRSTTFWSRKIRDKFQIPRLT